MGRCAAEVNGMPNTNAMKNKRIFLFIYFPIHSITHSLSFGPFPSIQVLALNRIVWMRIEPCHDHRVSAVGEVIIPIDVILALDVIKRHFNFGHFNTINGYSKSCYVIARIFTIPTNQALQHNRTSREGESALCTEIKLENLPLQGFKALKTFLFCYFHWLLHFKDIVSLSYLSSIGDYYVF